MRFKFIAVMAPTTARTLPAGSAWIHEPKLDGFRIQAICDSSGVRLFTRNGYFTARYPTIADAVSALPGPPFILDGELVAVGDDGSHDFRALMAAGSKTRAKLEFHAFDLLMHDGVDLRQRPLVERRIRLECLLHDCVPPLRLVDQYDDGEGLLSAADGLGLEGVVSKRRASQYVSGRTRQWLKIKTDTWRSSNGSRGELFEKR